MIDISKVQPGDMVTVVPLEVHSVDAGWVALFMDPDTIVHFNWDQILTHTPAPREIKVGDRVRVTGPVWKMGDDGKVIGLDDGYVYVVWFRGMNAIAYRPASLTIVEDGE